MWKVYPKYSTSLTKIGADLVTNLILLNPFLITLHDTELIQLEDCYSTYRTPVLTNYRLPEVNNWAQDSC